MNLEFENYTATKSVCRNTARYLLKHLGSFSLILILLFLSANLNAQSRSYNQSSNPVTQTQKTSHEKINDSNYFNGAVSSSTKPFATISSTGVGGNWNATTTWAGGIIPGVGDDVTIAPGAIVNIDAASACRNMTINATGSLTLSPTMNLDVNGNWVNNGTLTAGTGSVTFKSGGTNTISGASPSAFYDIIVDKGIDPSSIIEADGSGAISNTHHITITNGLFKMTTGTFQFNSAPSIPATGGIWINGATLAGGFFTTTNDGWIRVTAGTANFGTGSGNSLHNQNKGYIDISGGTVNIAGRLQNTAFGATALIGIPATGLSITGGTINISTAGNALANFGSFHMSQLSVLNMSGGTVVFQYASTATTPRDLYIINGGTKNITGGTFQFGNTITGQTFRAYSAAALYNLTVNNTANNVVSLDSALTVNNQLTLNSRLLLNNQNLILGSTAPAINGTLGANNGMIVSNNGATGGEVRKIFTANGSYLFPLGNVAGTNEYSPITLNFTSGTYAGGAYAGTKVVNSKHPNNPNSTNYIKRYWNVNTSGISSPVYNVAANYLTSDVAGTESNIAMGLYNSLPWVKYDPANTAVHLLTATGISNPGSVDFTGVPLASPSCSVSGPYTGDSTCSSTTNTATFTVTTDATSPTYSWIIVSNTTGAAISGSSTGSTVTITPGNNSGSFQLQVTITDPVAGTSTCTSNVIKVNKTPTVTASPFMQNACSGSDFNTIKLTSSDPSTQYVWFRTNSGNTIGMNASLLNPTSADSLPGALTNITSVIQPSTFVFTAFASNGCVATATATVNVFAPPGLDTIAYTGTAKVCTGQTLNLTNNTPGGVWASSNTAAATVNSSGVVTGVSGGSSIISYTITVVESDGTTCTNTAQQAVSVIQSPTVTASPKDTTICSGGHAILSSTGSGNTTPTTLCFTYSHTTAFQDNTPLTPIYAPVVVSGLPTNLGAITGITVTVNANHQRDQEVEMYLVAPGGTTPLSNAGGAPWQLNIASAGAGNAIRLSGEPTVGGTGQNFVNTVFSNATGLPSITTGTAPFTNTYAPMDPFSNLSSSINPNGTWNFIILDHINSGYTGVFYNVTLCFTFGSGTGTYTWTSNPSGFSSNVQSPGNVSPITNTTYYVTHADSTGCAATDSVVVTVNNTPNITLTSAGGTNNQTVCSGTAITNITYSITGNPTTESVSGLPSGVTYSYSSGVLTISGSSSTPGTYNYTVNASNSCGTATPATGTIVVATPPTTTGASICVGGTGSLSSSSTCPGGSPITISNVLAGTGATSGSPAWGNPTRVNAADGSSSTTAGINANSNSGTLSATSFNFSTIPNNAIITGIQVTINRSGNVANAINDGSVRLIVGGAAVGTNNANNSDQPGNWGTTLTAANYGSSNNLTTYWGVTLSGSDVNVNNANFGLAFVAHNATGTSGRTASIDYIRMTITYTVPGTFNWYTSPSGGSAIGSGTPFNPVGVSGSGLPNTNTPGTTTFYAECSTAPGCRTATNFVINPLPALFTVTGGGSFCQGGSGVPVGLSGSQSGVNYQLFRNGIRTGSPVAGTGGAITFGNQVPLATSTYTVTATNATTGCTNTMTGA